MQHKKKYPLMAAAFIITGLVGYFLYLALYHNRTISQVGDYKITLKDKQYRDRVHHVFYPNDPQNYGLEQLEKAFTYAQILKNNGLEINERMVRAEEMRINQNTKAPEVLSKIREIFGSDFEAYQKDFIIPTFAERTIYFDFFRQNQKAQAKSLAQVQNFLTLLKTNQGPLSELARQQGLTFNRFTLTKEKGIEWAEEKPQDPALARDRQRHPGLRPPPPPGRAGPPSGNGADGGPQAPLEVKQHVDMQLQDQALESAKYWVENVVNRMRPGEVFPEPVDHGENWLIVKFIKVEKQKKYSMEAVFFPKDSYQKWLDEETAKVPIRK